MIGLHEVKQMAAKSGSDPATVEKDYALSWMLKGIYSHDLLGARFVFKGGTALRKAFFADYRFSADLDFTLRNEISLEDLQTHLGRICQDIEEWSGMLFSPDLLRTTRESHGQESFEARISFIGPRGQRQDPPRLRLDMTRWEEVLLATQRRQLLHTYSDTCNANLQVVRLEEILAEKLRSILQRNRPRDLYDVWYLLKHYYSSLRDDIHSLFQRKCRFKSISYDGVEDFFLSERLASHRAAWDTSLRRLVVGLPPFDQVIRDLRILLPSVLGSC